MFPQRLELSSPHNKHKEATKATQNLLQLNEEFDYLQKYHIIGIRNVYSRTLDCEQLGLRVFYKTSKNFEGILTL
jgi:hypothetical protein